MKLLFLIFILSCSSAWANIDQRLSALETRQAITEASLNDYQKHLGVVFSMRDIDLSLAERNLEKRLDGMNEFRNQLKDQASTFLTRSEYGGRHADLENRISSMQLFQANWEGRIWMFGACLGLGLTIFQTIGFILIKKHKE